MKQIALALLLAGLPVTSPAAEDAPAPAPALSELAAQADLVALVRVSDTDYQYTRGFPSGGTAFLQVLIPYKVGRALEDFVEVYEEGLHDGECYFPNPSVLEEGRRFLVFLSYSKDVADQYNGLPGGCALEVFVTSDNLYALKFPVTGIALSEELAAYAEPLDFQDGYSTVEEEDLSPIERDDLLENGLLVPRGERFQYTHGIDLTTARKLLGPDIPTLDRSLK